MHPNQPKTECYHAGQCDRDQKGAQGTPVVDQHDYSRIIVDVMGTFKLNAIIRKAGFVKQDGYGAAEILALMMMRPLLLLNSVHSLYRSEFQKITTMKKDAIYRLQNRERMPWRKILYGVAKQCQTLTHPQKVVANTSAFIIDDTTDARVRRHIENGSCVFDHVIGKTKLGFKDLVLGYFDGKGCTPPDFSIHAEKALRGKTRKEPYKKASAPGSPDNTRRKECTVDKITSITMVKRAVKHGFRAQYVLTDSGFSRKGFIQAMREIKNHALHVVCGVRKDKRQYLYRGKKLDAQALHATRKKAGHAKRCRKLHARYCEVVVPYEDVGDVKRYLCRFPYQKQWRFCPPTCRCPF